MEEFLNYTLEIYGNNDQLIFKIDGFRSMEMAAKHGHELMNNNVRYASFKLSSPLWAKSFTAIYSNT